MKNRHQFMKRALLLFFLFATSTLAISQTLRRTTSTSAEQSILTKFRFDPPPRTKLQHGWHFQFSAGPAMIVPEGEFYANFRAATGGNIGFKVYHVNENGKPQGMSVGLTYQTVRLDYDAPETSGFGSPAAPPSGSVRVNIGALEAGRVFAIGDNGSNFYAAIGIALLEHKGEAPATDDLFGYQEEGRAGVKLDTGFAVQFSKNFGLDFNVGFTVMPVKRADSDLGNYTQTHFYGTLYKFGTGLFFLL